MSPFYTFCTSPMTGSSKPLLYFCFISFCLFSHTSSSAIPSGNTSEYAVSDVFHTTDTCYQDSVVKVKTTDVTKQSPYSIYTTTKECSARMHENDFPDKLPSCPPGLLDLEVTPDYIAKSQLSWPYANLHISAIAHAPIETVFFRLECLRAPDGSDVYCSDSKDMYINGIKEWPCRGMKFSDKVTFPAKFTYACFRFTPYSIYAINATVLPQKCRASTIITSPGFDEMFPEVLVDSSASKKESKDPFWAPTLAADFSDENAIWVRLGKAPKAECDTININVYKEYDNDSSKVMFLETLTVKCPEKAAKWENQAAGQYLLTAYVPHRGCQLVMCNSTSRGCTLCPRTHLHLQIRETRASIPWLAVQKFKDHSLEILIFILVLIGISIVVSLIVIAIYCWKKKKESERVRDIQLTDIVKPMIVYADDNHIHRRCVKCLVESLRGFASCDPIFDEEQLITSERVVPSRWLVDQLSTANKFIIVMSHCAERILDSEASETHHLIQARPFGDMFEPAIETIIVNATRTPVLAKSKYAIVRFAYSPPVPANLAVLNLPVFNLPAQFGHLTAFLHNLDYGERLNITQNVPEFQINTWGNIIQEQTDHIANNPEWIKDRWQPKNDQAMMELKRKPPVVLKIETDEDRIAASLKYNVMPPKADREEEEDDDQPTTSNVGDTEHTFLIKPPKPRTVEESSEEEDDDDEEEDEGSDTIVAIY